MLFRSRMAGSAILTGKGRAIPGDPIGQVLRQTRALTKLTGIPAAAVVCVPWMSNAPFVTRCVTVCSARDLPGQLTTHLPASRLTHGDVSGVLARVRTKH